MKLYRWLKFTKGMDTTECMTLLSIVVILLLIRQILKLLKEQVKSELFCVRWEYTVPVKMLKSAVKMV